MKQQIGPFVGRPPGGGQEIRTPTLGQRRRHAFAVHRLTAWYRDGVDIHSRLPWLSAYMGHDNLLGTEKYLTATGELLGMAAEQFERRFRGECSR